MLSVVLIFLSFLITFFSFKTKFIFAEHIQENWGWHKNMSIGMDPDKRLTKSYKNDLNGYKTKNGVYIFKHNKSFTSDEKETYFDLPLNGSGYFQYKKIGKEISFYSPRGEILWSKPFQSYPRSSHKGNLTLLLSGDNNRVGIIDVNGNYIGAEHVDGRFLVDYAFPYNKGGAIIVFSGGEYYRIDNDGKVLYKNIIDENNKSLFFFKSVAISPDAEFSAIHLLKDNKDYILVMDTNGKKKYDIELQTVYPHKIYMAVGQKGELLLNLPEQLLMFTSSGKPSLNIQKKKSAGVYNLAFSADKFFIANIGRKILFFTPMGSLLKQKTVSKFPVRVIPAKQDDLVYIETPDEIISLLFFKIDN